MWKCGNLREVSGFKGEDFVLVFYRCGSRCSFLGFNPWEKEEDMKIRNYSFAALFAVGILLLTGISVRAQGRFEITPFGGYETSGSYPLTNNSSISPLVDKLQVHDAVSYGTFLDHNLTENFQLEFMWDRNNTSYSGRQILTNTYSKLYNSDVDQFQFGGLYMLRNSSHAIRPYIAASVGFTHDGNDSGVPDTTKFGYSVGGGVKYYATRHLGFRVDTRFMPTYGSSSPGGCDVFYGCYTAHHFLNRGNFVGGIILRF
jgi:hypothetical protein